MDGEVRKEAEDIRPRARGTCPTLYQLSMIASFGDLRILSVC